ncbi:hypothetical protein BDV41DRAFT_206695 [Aspergillus transmontanensis]|uniref:Uncharacterized protein n=1 Tax=Aspergillus transmontanensis TaxID=1034304 RepID=A0A5N6VCN2_9EURO|nr:hypothetical protein BDV41DRAFT_206695 [Aspergillus transmontanensis]
MHWHWEILLTPPITSVRSFTLRTRSVCLEYSCVERPDSPLALVRSRLSPSSNDDLRDLRHREPQTYPEYDNKRIPASVPESFHAAGVARSGLQVLPLPVQKGHTARNVFNASSQTITHSRSCLKARAYIYYGASANSSLQQHLLIPLQSTCISDLATSLLPSESGLPYYSSPSLAKDSLGLVFSSISAGI